MDYGEPLHQRHALPFHFQFLEQFLDKIWSFHKEYLIKNAKLFLEKEFLELGEYELPVKRSDGKYGNISLKNMNDKLLTSFSEALKKSSDKASKERQEKLERFRQLRDMLSNASASGNISRGA